MPRKVRSGEDKPSPVKKVIRNKDGSIRKKIGAPKGVMPKYIPTRPCNYSEEEVAQALTENGGLIYETAQKIGVSPKTMFNYLKRWPGLRKVIKQARKLKLDRAEAKLGEKIEEGDLKAIIFFLRTQGKGRGYEVHKTVSVNAKSDVPIVQVESNPVVTNAKMREILDRVVSQCKKDGLPVTGPLQVGLKEIGGSVSDNKARVIVENHEGSGGVGDGGTSLPGG